MKIPPLRSIGLTLMFGVWSLCPACAWGHSADLAIYDFAKGAVINVSSNRFREMVIDASPRHTNFFTLTRLDAPKLIMRERGENGAVLSVLELPFFVSGFASHNWIKMSPDRTRLVFHKPATRGLSLLSLQNQEQRDVLRDMLPSELNIVLMKWLSQDTVLLLRRGVGGAAAAPGQILKIKSRAHHNRSRQGYGCCRQSLGCRDGSLLSGEPGLPSQGELCQGRASAAADPAPPRRQRNFNR